MIDPTAIQLFTICVAANITALMVVRQVRPAIRKIRIGPPVIREIRNVESKKRKSMPMSPYCPGTNCPIRSTCERFKQQIDYKSELYFASAPYNPEKKKCEMYWGPNNNALLNHIKDILNGKEKNDRG